jgi:hypothetical protein
VKDTNRKTRDQTTEDEQHGPIKNWGRRFQLIRKGTTSILCKWGKRKRMHTHCESSGRWTLRSDETVHDGGSKTSDVKSSILIVIERICQFLLFLSGIFHMCSLPQDTTRISRLDGSIINTNFNANCLAK